jgi:hypothetical protein
MPPLRVFLLTVIALLAFAGNSLLCRVALRQTAVDPASFTSIRIASAAVVLWLIALGRRPGGGVHGSWAAALALFA